MSLDGHCNSDSGDTASNLFSCGVVAEYHMLVL